MHSASFSHVHVRYEPTPPSSQQLAAARRQTKIRAALRQLSPRLQAVLEATYEPRPLSAPLRHEHGLAAGVVARALSALSPATTASERKQIEITIRAAHVLVTLAHEAFELLYTDHEDRTRSARRARCSQWLSDVGL